MRGGGTDLDGHPLREFYRDVLVYVQLHILHECCVRVIRNDDLNCRQLNL